MISLATFFTVILCINGINKAYAASVLGIDSAFNLIAGTKLLPVLVVLLWVIAVVLIFMMRTLEVMQISMARSAPTLYSMMSGEPSVDMCGSARWRSIQRS